MSTPPTKPKPAAEQLEFFDMGGNLIRTQAVEMAPGMHMILEPNLVPADSFPQYGTCQFVRRPDGSFVAVAKTHGQLIKLTKNIGRELGCKDANSKSFYTWVRRCIWAGFIRAKTMPDACYIDLHSLFSFLKKIEHPGYWTPARRKRYNEARDCKPDAEDSWPPKDTDA